MYIRYYNAWRWAADVPVAEDNRSYGRRYGWSVLLILKFFIFFAEAFNSTGRVNELLLAGEKGMALGANFNPDILFGGSCLDDTPACAFDGCLSVFWMDTCFHCLIKPPAFTFYSLNCYYCAFLDKIFLNAIISCSKKCLKLKVPKMPKFFEFYHFYKKRAFYESV